RRAGRPRRRRRERARHRLRRRGRRGRRRRGGGVPMTETVLDVLAGVLLIGGALLAFIAGLGILRFPDLLSRMHAATKPQVLGLMLLMAGLAIELRSVTV